MTKYYENDLYREEIAGNLDAESMRKMFRGKVFMITGARGLIGSELVDTLMYADRRYDLNCKVYAVVRNMQAAADRFREYENNGHFQLVQADINRDEISIEGTIDYLIHGASNTHPIYYATRPIDTILTNTVGTERMLRFASKHGCKRFVFLSSVEIYGENRRDVDKFSENYLGYLDCNTLRAGYPEGKRLGETLCQAYKEEKNLDCVIARISRAYGPGLLKEDSKALSQFLKNALNREDIVLKSKGDQFYSYVYVADVVSGLLFLIAHGQNGEAYNLSGMKSDVTLAQLAGYVAQTAGVKVIFDVPDAKEAAGYSKATKALLDTEKIGKLGWSSRYSIQDGIRRTLEMQGIK